MEFHCLTKADKRVICGWRYPGEYAAYDMPTYDEVVRAGGSFTDPAKEKEFLGFTEGGALVGFVRLKEEPKELFVGIGVAPELCGRGYGRQMLAQAAVLAGKRWPGKPLYLEVRTWNRRAIRCYEKAGFHIVGEPYELTTGCGPSLFCRMTRPI